MLFRSVRTNIGLQAPVALVALELVDLELVDRELVARELVDRALAALALAALALVDRELGDRELGEGVDKVVGLVDVKVGQAGQELVGADPELADPELADPEQVALEEGSKVLRRRPTIRNSLFGMQCSLTRTVMVNLAVTSL